jgi:hypothetical protein
MAESDSLDAVSGRIPAVTEHDLKLIAVREDKVEALMPPEVRGWGALVHDSYRDSMSGANYKIRAEGPSELNQRPDDVCDAVSQFNITVSMFNSSRRDNPIPCLYSTVRI